MDATTDATTDARITVRLNAAADRYELWVGDELVGHADFTHADRVLTVPYVETAPAHRGRGYAALLMDGIVDDLRARSLTIRPICSYAASYMSERPDTHDLYA